MTLQDNIEEIQNHLASRPSVLNTPRPRIATRRLASRRAATAAHAATHHSRRPRTCSGLDPLGPGGWARERSGRAAWGLRRGRSHAAVAPCRLALPPDGARLRAACPTPPRHRRLVPSQAISSPRTRRWAARTSPPTGCGPTTTRACPSSSSRRRTCMPHAPHMHAACRMRACVCCKCACVHVCTCTLAWAMWAMCAVRGGVRMPVVCVCRGTRGRQLHDRTRRASTRHGGPWHVRCSTRLPSLAALPPRALRPCAHPGDHSRASGAAGAQANDGQG